MLSPVTLNQVLGRFLGSVMCVPIEVRIMRECFDNDSADLSRFGISSYVIPDNERFGHRSNPVSLIQSLRCVCDGRKQSVGILPGVAAVNTVLIHGNARPSLPSRDDSFGDRGRLIIRFYN